MVDVSVTRGENILILGGSSGVGSALIGMVAPKFHRIYCISRRGTIEVPYDNCKVIACDVRNYDVLKETIMQIQEKDKINILVNTVGVGYYAPLEEECYKEWKEIIDTNLLGLCNIFSVVLRHLKIKQFIQVGSLASYRPSKTPGNELYSATKAASVSLLKEFRSKLKQRDINARVTLISPGFIGGTDFSKNYFESHPNNKIDLFGQFRALEPKDVAELILMAIEGTVKVEISEIIIRSNEQLD